MEPPQRLKLAMLIAAVLIVCSLAANRVLDPSPSAGFVMLPGIFAGLFVSTMISIATTGNNHGGDYATMLVVASLANFCFYAAVTYGFISLLSRPTRGR